MEKEENQNNTSTEQNQDTAKKTEKPDKNLDYEHIEYYLPDFYNEYSYWELYFVSSLMNSLNENRQLHMIYSVFDFCCFDSPDSIMLKNAIDQIDLQNLYIYLNNSDKHEIFPEQVFDIER